MTNEGWTLLGWCDAPTKGAGPHAIVYEKTTPRSDEEPFEPGIYWGHGNAKNMQFVNELPSELEAELGPWVRRHNAELNDRRKQPEP